MHDMAMAERAGVARIAVSYGAQNAEQLKACEPVYIADHFDDITDWLALRR